MRVRLSIGTVLLAVGLFVTSVRAAGLDLHWLWDDRCAACHGHAGDFARTFLNAAGDELQGRHHVHDLRRFLYHHYLPGSEVDAVYSMLLAQAGRPARYRDECGNCHPSAANFVRDTLVLRDGMLYSRASGRPVRGFLDYHGNLQPADVDFFMRLLSRVAHEVWRP